MSGYHDFSGAPRMGDAFRGGGAPHLTPTPPGHDPDDDLDHLDLSVFDYTPGGTVEQQVHTEISKAGRAAHRAATSGPNDADPEEHYRRQMEEEFDRRIAELEEHHDTDPDDPDEPERPTPSERDDTSDLDLSAAELRQQIDRQLKTLGPTFGSVTPNRGMGPDR